MRHSLAWFMARIGKRIYRLTKTNCCAVCDKVYQEGVVIRDRQHATYIKDVQDELRLIYSVWKDGKPPLVKSKKT